MRANRVSSFAFLSFASGVPGLALGSGFSLVPIGSTGAHAINGQEIRIPAGAATVTLEVRVFGWDPNHDGSPRLNAYQAQIDSAGFASGSSGVLSDGRQPCTTSADCPSGHACLSVGVCDMSDHVFIDPGHPNYVFSGVGEIHAVDFSIANLRFGGVVDPPSNAAVDTGAARYGGTLRLDVPADARGTFTVGFIAQEAGDGSFVVIDTSVAQWASPLVPALITIVHEDCNVNGVHDGLDLSSGTSRDCDSSGVPDECENDCNGNGWEDSCDISDGCSQDCNGNGTPDECEADCNHNAVADACDIAAGTSVDGDANGVPDECQGGSSGDCNHNGLPDGIDISGGSSQDCNVNGFPDECELAGGDCNHNGVPDNCEPDCNSNGSPDACDISGGTSLDLNGDGVPDDCVTTIAWVPIHASRGYYITGKSIVIPAGITRITLEAQISGWDLDRNGDPTLYLYQVSLDSSGYSSGSTGSLGPAHVACTSDNDCRGASVCILGTCDNQAVAYIDESRPDFVLAGHDVISATDVSQPDFRFGATIGTPVGAVVDDGRAKYGGTLLLDTSAGATGTFTIGFVDVPGTESFLAERDPFTTVIPIGAMRAATITILDDCNGNGASDASDIINGFSDCDDNGFPDECDMTMAPHSDCNTNGVYDACESLADCNGNGMADVCDLAEAISDDANGNGVPDECEIETPSASAIGGRHLEVRPAGGGQPVALRVTSPNHACLTKYVTLANGIGRLSDTPDYRNPQEWGRVVVTGTEITPSALYDVAADFGDGVVSVPARTATGRWGNIVEPHNVVNFQDVSAIVEVFKGAHCAVPAALADIYPAVPNGIVNFQDVTAGVDAFKGKPYPFTMPCP